VFKKQRTDCKWIVGHKINTRTIRSQW